MNTQGFYVSYDRREYFAIMCHGSRRQNNGYCGDWFYLPMVDGGEQILRGPHSPSASACNERADLPPDLRLHETSNVVGINMIYVTEKYVRHLKKVRPELWPDYARAYMTEWFERRRRGRVEFRSETYPS